MSQNYLNNNVMSSFTESSLRAMVWMLVYPCVLTKFVCWNSNIKVIVLVGMAFGRWLGNEDEALMNEIIAPIKETPYYSLPCSALWSHDEQFMI